MHRHLPRKPPNFSWILENKLCAMGFPDALEHLIYLQENNVTHLISLTAEMEPPYKALKTKSMRYTNFKVKDFTPPSIPQIERCLHIIEQENNTHGAVGIHCAKGYGRTGTVLACYYVKFCGLSGDQAIEKIRLERPGSIETEEQENCVLEFEIVLKNKKTLC